MPERSPARGSAWLALGLLLAGACWFDLGAAAAFAWLAQIPAALGVALLRGSRDARGLAADSGRLALRWGGGVLAVAALLAWPVGRLLADPGLGHALLLSAMAGLLLLLQWWQWPEWQQLECLGGGAHARRIGQRMPDRQAWSGLLLVALPVFCLLLGGLLLAWPGLLAGTPRLLACIAYVGLLPLAHAVLQSAEAQPRLHGLPVVEMEAEDPVDPPLFEPLATPVDAAAPATGSAPVTDTAALDRELYATARNGRVERALALLEAGANPMALPEADARDRRSLPMLAAVLPDLRLLRALIERGVDVNAMQAGMSPLLAATRDSWHGRPEAVMTLLANGADPRLADAEGNTPLHHAARSSDPGVAALLRDAGAGVDALNHEGVSPLGSACTCSNWRLARFLLERGAKPEPDGGQPVLLCAAACEDDDVAGVQLLLRHKARVNALDAQNRSALHEAAAAGHPEIAQALLDAGAQVNARDAKGRTPLLEAVRVGALPVLERLLAADADLRACDGEGSNALHLACTAEAPSIELLRDLLALGLDPHADDAQGRSALDLALAAGRWTLVAVLDPQRALPVALAEDDGTRLERPPQLLLRESLLDGSAAAQLDALAALLEPHDFDVLLGDAEVAALPARVAWLLRQGANAEASSSGAPSPVQAALARGEAGIDTLRILFASAASPAGAGGLARFLAACAPADARAQAVALELLERGADPFGPSPAGDAPVVLAARLGWRSLLQRLLALGVNPDSCDARGMGALHVAATQGDEDTLKLLVMHGAAPDRRAADGLTPLGIALACGRRSQADWLDWRDWRLPHRPLVATDVPAAAIVGDLDAVRRLLALGLPVDATDSQGCTALLRAAGGGHRALVDFLLRSGADPGRAAQTGATALSAAVSMRHLDIVDLLLKAGSGLEQRLPGDVTVLMLAAALGLPELVSRLLQAGADLHAADAQGLTPLHCAALYGFTARDRTRQVALLDALLLAGADPHRSASNGLTPLLLLLGARSEPGTPVSEDVLLAALDRLLDEDVQLDVRDARGYGPLHLAALHGLQLVAEDLLRAGANPDVRDNAGRTPREVAQMRGYMDIAALLAAPAASPAPNVSLARFLRE